MKLILHATTQTAFLCLLFQTTTPVSAHPFMLPRPLSVENRVLQESQLKAVLSDLEKRFHVSFVYMDQLVRNQTVAHFTENNHNTVEEELTRLLTPFHLTFKRVTEKQITITALPAPVTRKKEKNNTEKEISAAPLGIIKGRILAATDHTPLPGARISVKGKNTGAITNNEGVFQLNVTPGDVLVISYVGYDTQEISVGNQTSWDIELTATAQKMGEVVVIGSRGNIARTNVEKPVPIDVISGKEMQKTGQTELGQMIHFSAPSFNSTKHGISNVTSYVDPATLRGLGPDQTLVLINGKRRHQSSALNVNNVVGRGTVGTDLNAIPTAAIERVEILRDGAAAQYGSDAIAGIVNIQLKRNDKGGSVTGHYGATKEGDGQTYEQAVNFGLPLGRKGGFINTTFQFHHNEPTDRSGDYTGRVYVNDKTQDDAMVKTRNFNRDVARYGIAKNTMGVGFYNAELPMGKNWTLYSFGGYSYKDMTAYGFLRPPSNEKRTVLNIYPNGYSPVFPGTLKDVAATAGLKKTLATGWNMDFSTTYGSNRIDMYVNNTVNPSYGEASPVSFYTGSLAFGQSTSNVNFSKNFRNIGALESFSMALGAEFRMERYRMKAGDEASWKKGPVTQTDVGSSGREGISVDNAIARSRNNIGVYVDVESDITKQLLLGAAIRFENYSDFGANLSGKLSARWKLAEAFALRGSVNRSFRAPSMHQLYYSSNADAQWLTINGIFDSYPVAHLRNDNPYVQQLGVGKLKAEISMDYNAGFTLQLGHKFLMTVDAYQIDIKDRVVISAQLDATSTLLAPVFNGSGYAQVQFFSNAVDTRTKGLDMVATYREKFNPKNELTLNAAVMLNQTRLIGNIRTPDKLQALGGAIIDRIMIGLIEVAQPRNKVIVSANYRLGKVEALIRGTRFGEVTARQGDAKLDQTFGAKIITDVALTYNITPHIAWSAGANNIGNVYPDKIAHPSLTSSGQTPYTRFTSQFGFMGAYYYSAIRIGF
ncbi:TonB-dependent receptor [Chitinophaga nivalis]|uniref:TonB-dependent receptor n=1 Tax=Chitinophaga nivalis TaxID=2991709 RepID=A0ABT3IS32_9BACT|nr:TonB-dependent receptor [Chitinophaga nivalis]MCW3463528.1 TonB-dependent receptor [Chitinophaga nivalis]MCW3486782.1 TonB-dependent receptor [Chitinophaga nivalis]